MLRAIIIGAGPAGSIAAICLAGRDFDVTVIEQHRFPRDKVCGECLSALGMEVLQRLHLADEVRRYAVPLMASALYGPTGEQAILSLARPMWGITRRRLDHLLLQNAVAAGAKLLQPARCEAIDGTSVRIRHLTDNSLATLDADWIFLADGKGSLLPNKPRLSEDFGVQAHFRDLDAPPATIGLYALNGHYVGVAPVEGNTWNIAFSAPLSAIQSLNHNFDSLLETAMSQNATLASHLRRASRANDWLISPLPRFPAANHWPRNVIPLGNAAAALEPIGGEGMGLAMRSAELAVENLGNERATARGFSKLWNMRSKVCRLTARLMSHPSISGPSIELIAANERISRPVMSMMGKF